MNGKDIICMDLLSYWKFKTSLNTSPQLSQINNLLIFLEITDNQTVKKPLSCQETIKEMFEYLIGTQKETIMVRGY